MQTKRMNGWMAVLAITLAGLLAPGTQAADQWWDTSNASGLTPGIANWDTGTAAWAASASPGTASPVIWANGNNAWFTANGHSTATVNNVTANLITMNAATYTYTFLPGTGPLTVNGGITNIGVNSVFRFFSDITLGNSQTWFLNNNANMLVTGKVSGAGVTLTKAGGATLSVSNALNSIAGLVIDAGGVSVYNDSLGLGGGGPLTLGGSNQFASAFLTLYATAAGSNAFTIGNLTVAGGSRVDFNAGTAKTNVLNGQTLSRIGRGTVLVNETGTGALGTQNKLLLTGGTTMANGMLPPWVMGESNDPGSGGTPYFVTYDPVQGVKQVTYDTGAWDSTKKINASSGTTLNQNTNVYALALNGTLNNNAVLTVGDGNLAGLAVKSGGIYGSGTLSFGTAELIVTPALTFIIGNTLSGSGGLTVNGPAANSGNASLVLSNMTYTGDTRIYGGTLTVAPSGTTTYTNAIFGAAALFTKSGPGTLILKDNTITLGVGAVTVANGTLALTNATLISKADTLAGAINVGTAAGDVNRQMTVANSTLNCGLITVGGNATAVNNQMTVANSTVSSVGLNIGNGGNSNTVTVGQGTIWNVNNTMLAVGVNVGNTLIIDGGTVTNHSGNEYVGNGSAASGNQLIIRNGGKLFKGSGSPDMFVGGLTVGSSNNLLQVGGSGAPSYANMRNLNVGGNGAQAINGNQVVVTNGTLESANNVAIGQSGANNSVSVLSGGTWTHNGNALVIGAQAGGSSNWVLVSGGVVSNSNNDVQIGNAANANYNSLIISNGGTLVCRGLAAGNNASAIGNVVRVSSGGILEPLIVGGGTLSVGSGAGNMITNSGGVYQFGPNGIPTITTNGAPGGCIFLDNGALAFRGITTANVKANWTDTKLKRITFSGANAFRLNNAMNNSGAAGAQSYLFDTGIAVTNYAGLEMFNGSTAYTNGSVTIGSNGWLTFSDTAAVMYGAVTNAGTMRFIRSTVTFKNGLTLANGSKIICDTNAASFTPITVSGALNASGTISLDVSSLVTEKPVQLTLFEVTGAISDTATWNVTPAIYKVSKQGNTLAIVQVRGTVIRFQ